MANHQLTTELYETERLEVALGWVELAAKGKTVRPFLAGWLRNGNPSLVHPELYENSLKSDLHVTKKKALLLGSILSRWWFLERTGGDLAGFGDDFGD